MLIISASNSALSGVNLAVIEQAKQLCYDAI
jgi:hypothetical protein